MPRHSGGAENNIGGERTGSTLFFYTLCLWRCIFPSFVTTIIHITGITVFFERMPISYYLIGAVVQFGLVLFVRFAYGMGGDGNSLAICRFFR